jgi:hypothetical protein
LLSDRVAYQLFESSHVVSILELFQALLLVQDCSELALFLSLVDADTRNDIATPSLIVLEVY